MAKDTNTTVIIKCNGSSGRFVFSNISYALIHGLHFVGCGGNIVTHINHFLLNDTIFQGVEGRGTALVLNDLYSAKIVSSWFLSNTQGHFRHDLDLHHVLSYLSQELVEVDSETVSIGGAFYSISCNITVEGTVFEANSAELFGGAITAEDSDMLIKHCRFMINKAGNGTSELTTGFGMIFSYDSDILVHGSMFIDNIAAIGGVLLAYGGRIYISSSTFSNNRATKYGGVIGSKLSSCDIIY